MTLDEDSIQIDEDPTDKFVRDDASAAYKVVNPDKDPWSRLNSMIDNAELVEAPHIHFRLDEAYTRRVLEYAINSKRVHLPQIKVGNYNLRKKVIPIWGD